MEKISTEILISSLFKMGFDMIDPVLFTYTLANIDNQEFAFEEQEFSIGFKKYIDDSGVVVKFKDGYTKDTNVSPTNHIEIPAVNTLFGNRKLTEYLNGLNFEEIIERKATIYGVTDIDGIDKEFFSQKEIDILKNTQVRRVLKKNHNEMP